MIVAVSSALQTCLRDTLEAVSSSAHPLSNTCEGGHGAGRWVRPVGALPLLVRQVVQDSLYGRRAGCQVLQGGVLCHLLAYDYSRQFNVLG